MTDTPHLVNALAEVGHDTMPVAELTARIILLYDRLRAIDPDEAAHLLQQLPNRWHGPHLVN
jgi:hypothetical protein